MQSTLAALTTTKYDQLRKLKSNLGAAEREACLAIILRVVNLNDEPILQDLVMDYLFKPDSSFAPISGHDALVLINFFLGYCSSDQQVQQACQVSMLKQPLKSKDFFLPLLDDWFIRPLYFVSKLDD